MIAASVKTDVSGCLALLSVAKQRGVTLKGVKAGAKLLKAAARDRAPKRKGSGALKQAQGVLAKKGRKGLTVSFAVQGARKKVVKMVRTGRGRKPVKAVPAFYDHLVQLGTRPHALGKGESLGRGATGRRKVVARTGQRKGGKHPGTKANPYRLRAWNSVKAAAGQATLLAMGAEVLKVLARQRAKVT